MYWRYIFLEGQKKTVEIFRNVAHVTVFIRTGKFPQCKFRDLTLFRTAGFTRVSYSLTSTNNPVLYDSVCTG